MLLEKTKRQKKYTTVCFVYIKKGRGLVTLGNFQVKSSSIRNETVFKYQK